MLTMTCPHCRRSLTLDEAARGQLASCPYCQGEFRAPLYDHETAIAGEAAGAATVGDSLARAATIFAALGALAVWGVVLSRFLGRPVVLPTGLLLGTLILPVIAIGLSWYCNRRTSRPGFIYASRILGYVWLLGQLYLVTSGGR